MPQKFVQQKPLYTLLIMQFNVRGIHTLIINPNKTALLILTQTPPSNFQRKLKSAIDNNIELIAINHPKMPRPPSEKKPTVFSIVINEHAIRTELDRRNLPFNLIWRIKSKKTTNSRPLSGSHPRTTPPCLLAKPRNHPFRASPSMWTLPSAKPHPNSMLTLFPTWASNTNCPNSLSAPHPQQPRSWQMSSPTPAMPLPWR